MCFVYLFLFAVRHSWESGRLTATVMICPAVSQCGGNRTSDRVISQLKPSKVAYATSQERADVHDARSKGRGCIKPDVLR